MATQKRQLTVNFDRSVQAGVPQVMEVAVNPLAEPSSPGGNVTLVGGPQTQDVLLANDVNTAIFMLVPTDYPGLTERVPYRIAWRERYMGKQETHDFVMPDFDCDFDDLGDLGNLIGGETYVQWSDRSRTGGVAGLNDAGQVIDAFGEPVLGTEAATTVQGNLDAEVVARQQGDQQTRIVVFGYVDDQVATIYTSTANSLAQAVSQLHSADVVEKAARINGDNALQAAITALTTSTGSTLDTLTQDVTIIQGQIPLKADLVGGKVPTSQIPDMAITKSVPIANDAARLALTSAQITPGDFAVSPNGIWLLNANPPSDPANWVEFNVTATVSSVNGKTGAVVLSAADVGARPVGVPLVVSDVSGLQSALNSKTDVTVHNALVTRVTTLETDPTTVHTGTGGAPAGLIAKTLMPADTAFINPSNLVCKKDGTVLNLSGGGTLQISDVSGLQPALDAKLNATDPSVTNARTPTPHATSHQAGGTDALFPQPQTAITGLDAIITNNELTGTSEHETRIASLETRVEDIELGGGGGGTGAGASGKTTWWNNPSPVSSSTDPNFSTVSLRSPFGYNATSGYYYNPAGVDPSEAVWAYLTPNGHLKFITRNESAAADPVLATQASLDTTNAQVATKASQGSLDTTNATVATKANQSDLDAANAVIATKADQSALNATNTAVSLKAAQSALDATNATVGTKAAQSDLDALTATVGTKAAASDLTALSSTVTGKADATALATTNTTVASKANQSDLTALTTTVGTKANQSDLTTTNANVTALQNAMPLKADLVGGLIPTAQLPAIAITNTFVVANRGGMLALSAQTGDVCIITATADQGTYILQGADPTQFTNWVEFVTPAAPVSSVNGQTGVVVLDAAAVGARSSAVPVNQSDVSGLTAALNSKANSSDMTTALAGKTSVTDVQAQISASTNNKPAAQLVATVAVPSTAGQQSIDGVLTPLGAAVLLTAQPSSVNNGLWIVNSGAWTRSPDMDVNTYFVKGTIVPVSSGTNQHDTIWQQTSPSGVVGTAANNWAKVFTGGVPPTYTASLGVQKVGQDFRAQTVSGGGISVTGGGLQLDPNVAARKVAMDVPAGSTIVTLTHSLNTTDVIASFRDKAAGDAVLVGWKPTGPNTISVEFDSAPATAQWRAVICG
jgi:hypothetical protein